MPERFDDVLDQAVDDILANGFDSQERVDRWVRRLREAARNSLVSAESMEQRLRDALSQRYRKMVDDGGILRFSPGVERFTLDRVKPSLRAELDRRIMASAELIRLNREQAIDKTLQRFSGWSTSIPKGGVSAEGKREVKKRVKKSMQSLPFEERRVLVDQGHKLVSAINEIVAADGGAIAGRWHSHYRQPGYDYREDHKERDDLFFLVRDSWAHRAGLVKTGKAGYVDESTSPGQEPFCFPGDTPVSASNVERAYRRHYDGDFVTIITASGRRLRATPNHPILTSKGWVAIGCLDTGDDVIEIVEEKRHRLEHHEDDAIPGIVEVFDAILESGGLHSSRKGQLHQFHGDGSDDDVDVIDAARPLSFGRHAAKPKTFQEPGLAHPRLMEARCRAIRLFVRRCLRAAARVMGGLSQALAPGFAFAGHSHSIGGATTAHDASCSTDNVAHDLSGNLQFDGEGQDALSAFMGHANLSRVVSVERSHFAGHVYNLQTERGWYVAGGIVAHNCRCYYTWAFNLRDLPPEMLTAKGRKALDAARQRADDGSSRADDAADGRSRLVGLDEATLTAIARAAPLDRMGWMEGVSGIRMVPDKDAWHAQYDDRTDWIELQEKFRALSLDDKVETLLHEVGHRGQALDPKFFGRFRRLHLDRLESFASMANAAHLEDFRRRGKVDGGLASEVFAESYGRTMTGRPAPADLAGFWSKAVSTRRRLSTKADAGYSPGWPSRPTRCQRCSMFLPTSPRLDGNSCTAVEGDISAHGHCRLFEPIGVGGELPVIGPEAERWRLARLRDMVG